MEIYWGVSNADVQFPSYTARISVLRRLNSALYRIDAVVTLHTSDNYGMTPQTRHKTFAVLLANTNASFSSPSEQRWALFSAFVTAVIHQFYYFGQS